MNGTLFYVSPMTIPHAIFIGISVSFYDGRIFYSTCGTKTIFNDTTKWDIRSHQQQSIITQSHTCTQKQMEYISILLRLNKAYARVKGDCMLDAIQIDWNVDVWILLKFYFSGNFVLVQPKNVYKKYSRTSIIRHWINQHLNYPALSFDFLCNTIRNFVQKNL